MGDAEITARELAEAIVDRFFPMADYGYREDRIQDTVYVIEVECFDDNYEDNETLNNELDDPFII